MGERVGMVGVGFMEQRFAVNLLRAGFNLKGFDVDSRRMREFEDMGGIPVFSAAKAAHGACWILTSLPDSEIVRRREILVTKDGCEVLTRHPMMNGF